MKRVLLNLGGLLCGLLLTAASLAATPGEARLQSLVRLLAAQQADGRWDAGAHGLDVHVTTEALEALRQAGMARSPEYRKALAWLSGERVTSVDAEARRGLVLAAAGLATTAVHARLTGDRNPAFEGWGAYAGDAPSVVDTALALAALIAALPAGDDLSGLNRERTFLLAQQHTDGGFPWALRTASSRSAIVPTTEALRVLGALSGRGFAVAQPLAAAVSWLQGRQKADGSFGAGATGTLVETLAAVRALAALRGAADPAVVAGRQWLAARAGGGHAIAVTAALAGALDAAPLADGDGDGWPDAIELLRGTDPALADASLAGAGNGRAVAGLTTARPFAVAELGRSFSQAIAFPGAVGQPVFRLVAGALPDGLLLAADGTISGRANRLGRFAFAYVAEAGAARSQGEALLIEVIPASAAAAPVQLPLPGWAPWLLGLLLLSRLPGRRLVSLAPRLLAGLLLVTMLVPGVQAAHRDVAPMPDEVHEQVVLRFGVGGDDLPHRIEAAIAALASLADRVAAGDHDAVGTLAGRLDGEAVQLEALIAERLDERRGRFARAARRDGIRATDALQATLAERLRRYTGLVRRLALAADPDARTAAVTAARAAIAEWQAPGRVREQLRRVTPTLEQAKPRTEPSGAETLREPAYLSQRGPRATAPGAGVLLPVTLPPAVAPGAAACSFVSDDVAADGRDVVIDAEIRELAASLGHSPARIFEWVVNHIDFEPYWGAVKGGKGALVSGRANATDHASLLIALLRASNIPARYVKGRVGWSNSDRRFWNWIGTRDLQSAGSRIATNGIHAGTIDATRVFHDHVWVEACVPFDAYRGAELASTGYRWTPLDASFKQYDYQAGIDVAFNFDFDSFLAERANGPESLVRERHTAGVLALARLQQPGASEEDIPFRGVQRKVRIGVLPAALPYQVHAFLEWTPGGTAETARLPEAHHVRVRLELTRGDNVPLIHPLAFSLVELARQRLTLSFDGVSGDLATLAAWRSSTTTNAVLPCNVNIQMSPRVRLEGIIRSVPTGHTAPLCATNLSLSIGVTAADAGAASPDRIIRFENSVAAADVLALFVYAKQASDRFLLERTGQLLSAIRRHPAGPAQATDEIVGEFLHLVGLKYFRYMDDAWRSIGRELQQTGDAGLHIGRTFTSAQIVYAFDLPYGLARTGWVVDVPGGLRTSSPLAAQGGAEVQWQSFRVSGLAASQLESYIWQEMVRTDAVSTVRGLQYANEHAAASGGTVTLTPQNLSTGIGQLLTAAANPVAGYTTAEIQRLRGLVEAGATVRVPRQRLAYVSEGHTWRGTVWLSEQRDSDPVTPGEQPVGSYQISEDASGGYARFPPSPPRAPPPPLITPAVHRTVNAWFGSQPAAPPPVHQPPTRVTPPPSSPPATTALLAPAAISSAVSKGFSDFVTKAGDPVNMVTGNYVHSEVDFWLKGRGGLPLVLERTYNSMEPRDGPFGFGWTHSFNHQLAFLDDDSDGRAGEAEDGDGIPSTLVWTDGSGAERYIGVTGASAAGLAGASLTPPRGFYFVTQRTAAGTYTLREKNGLTYTFEARDGRVSDRPARLLGIADRNGNTLTLAYNANEELATVTDGLGRALSFSHSGGRISRVCDWTHRCREYRYDTATANLTEVWSPLALTGQGAPTRYRYYTAADGGNIDHAMRELRQPSGETMTFEYYLNGRVFRHRNALGETSTFRYNDFRRETVHISERGFERRFFFDALGNPLKILTESGAEHRYFYEDARDPHLRTREIDPLGHEIRYAYDAMGNLVTETLPSTATGAPARDTRTYRDFNAFAQPQKVKDARGFVTVYVYDERGNRTDAIRINTTDLDPVLPWTPQAHRIAAWTRWTYDLHGNVTGEQRVRDFAQPGSGPRIEYGYADLVNGVDGLNAVTITRRADRDGDGVVAAAEVDTANQVYDALGRLTRGVDAGWHEVDYAFDADDRLVAATDALGQLRRYRYDAAGKLVQERLEGTRAGVASLEDSRSIEYDAAGRAVRVVSHAGQVLQRRFDAAGNVVAVTDADGHTHGFRYDAGNHWVAAIDPLGGELRRQVDVAGRVRSVTDPGGHTVSYSYHGAERAGALRAISVPLSEPAGAQVLSFEVDAEGHVLRETETAATGEQRDWVRRFDALGRLTRVAGPAYADPDAGGALRRPVTVYVYDGLSRLLEVQAGWCAHAAGAFGGCSGSDSLSRLLRQGHDELGRVLWVRRTDSTGVEREWRYRHDRHGNVLTETTPAGQVTHYQWGHGHQLLRSVAADGHVIEVTRNALGQPVTVASPEVVYRYGYDAGHRLVSVEDSRAGKRLRYRWSPGGLLDARVDGEGGETVYRRDPLGRLSALALPGGEIWHWQRDLAGRPLELSSTAGVTRRYTWRADGRLRRVETTAGGQRLSAHEYHFDGYGRRSEVTDLVRGDGFEWRYSHDGRDMLTAAAFVIGTTSHPYLSWRFDALGTPTRVTHTDGRTDRMLSAWRQVRQVDRHTAAGVREGTLARQSFDANGALLSKETGQGILTLTWDARGQLASARTTGANPVTETYGYDGLGRRISVTRNGVRTDWLYDGEHILAEYTGGAWASPSLRQVHGEGTDEVLARTPLLHGAAQPTEYYAADGLGSLVALARADGSALRGNLRDAWGRTVWTAPGGALPPGPGFTGREQDTTGLVYYRARYYDPAFGGICGFRPMPVHRSGACRPLIPAHAGSPFRRMPATDSGACRSSVPATTASAGGSVRDPPSRLPQQSAGTGTPPDSPRRRRSRLAFQPSGRWPATATQSGSHGVNRLQACRQKLNRAARP